MILSILPILPVLFVVAHIGIVDGGGYPKRSDVIMRTMTPHYAKQPPPHHPGVGAGVGK